MPNTKGMETWTSKSASFINTGRGGPPRRHYVRVYEIQDKTRCPIWTPEREPKPPSRH
jgi:hypothetical protein